MDLDIFKTEQEEREARVALEGLLKHPGWTLIIKALDANIAFRSDELRKKKDLTSLEQLYALQDRISDLESFKNLPQDIIKETENQPEPEEDEVYES